MSGFDLLTIDIQSPDAPVKLVTSMRETGFAVLTGHSFTPERIAEVYEAWGAFFGSDKKHDYTVDPATQTGYFPFLSENAKGAKAKDLKEFYHVYPHAALPSELEPLTRALYEDLVSLGQKMLGWIDENSPAEVRALYSEPLAGMLDDSDMNLLRILHYPPLESGAEPGAVRAAAHEDINLITLLLSGSAPGLQAQNTAGTWHDVPCDPGMIIVNVGDMLWKASGGYYPSTTHRVVNPPAEDNVSRYSMPMFLHPRPEVKLDEAYTADKYLQERLREIGLKQ